MLTATGRRGQAVKTSDPFGEEAAPCPSHPQGRTALPGSQVVGEETQGAAFEPASPVLVRGPAKSVRSLRAGRGLERSANKTSLIPEMSRLPEQRRT
jgi:hypothetical protein